jgi:hypothetical protein
VSLTVEEFKARVRARHLLRPEFGQMAAAPTAVWAAVLSAVIAVVLACLEREGYTAESLLRRMHRGWFWQRWALRRRLSGVVRAEVARFYADAGAEADGLADDVWAVAGSMSATELAAAARACGAGLKCE